MGGKRSKIHPRREETNKMVRTGSPNINAPLSLTGKRALTPLEKSQLLKRINGGE